MMNLKILTRWCTKRAAFTAHHRAKANRSLEHIRRTYKMKQKSIFQQSQKKKRLFMFPSHSLFTWVLWRAERAAGRPASFGTGRPLVRQRRSVLLESLTIRPSSAIPRQGEENNHTEQKKGQRRSGRRKELADSLGLPEQHTELNRLQNFANSVGCLTRSRKEAIKRDTSPPGRKL